MIRQAVIDTLSAHYPSITIYTDEVLEQFLEPSFYIKTIASSQVKDINTRYTRRHSFDIQYFGVDRDACESMALELYDNLSSISIANGRKMNYDVIDNVLHFKVEYAIRVDKVVEESPTMNNLEVDKDVK